MVQGERQRVAQLTTTEYDALERAIVEGRRIAVNRRGTEYTVIPLAIRVAGAREVIAATHPTTGYAIDFIIDEVDSIEVIPDA